MKKIVLVLILQVIFASSLKAMGPGLPSGEGRPAKTGVMSELEKALEARRKRLQEQVQPNVAKKPEVIRQRVLPGLEKPERMQSLPGVRPGEKIDVVGRPELKPERPARKPVEKEWRIQVASAIVISSN